MSYSILVVDDDNLIKEMLYDILSEEGYTVFQASDQKKAMNVLSKNTIDIILLDLWLYDDIEAGGLILDEINKNFRNTAVIIISGHGDVQTAVDMIKRGAYDFIEKPFVIDKLLLTIERATKNVNLKKENEKLKNRFNHIKYITGKSYIIKKIKIMMNELNNNIYNIGLSGAVGTGLNDLAFYIHKEKFKKNGNFIIYNPKLDGNFFTNNDDNSFESNFIFEAQFGTLVLEELHNLSYKEQDKLTKLIRETQHKEIYDVHMICTYCKSNILNRELYDRLFSRTIDIPSLAERRDDILDIMSHFIDLNIYSFDEDTMHLLMHYNWPGNIDQLEQCLQWIKWKANSEHVTNITKNYLPDDIIDQSIDTFDTDNYLCMPIKQAKEYFEKNYFIVQLQRFNGNVSQMALYVEMERSALHRKLKQLGVFE